MRTAPRCGSSRSRTAHLRSAGRGGYGREYAALRVSFRSKADALAALHGPVDRDLAVAHEQAPSGVAVVSVPGGPVMRLRTEDFPGGEDAYIAQIRATLAAQRGDGPL